MPPLEATAKGLRTRSLLEIHLAVFLFGFPGLFGKWLPLSPPLIVLGRVLLASLTLGAVLAVRRASFRISRARDLRLFILCGFILAVHWTMFFRSVQISTVAVGLLSYSSFPVFTAFLEPLALRERWDPWSLFFAVLTMGGVFLMVPGYDLSDPIFQGVLWGLGAGLTFAFLAVLNRSLARRHSSLKVAFYQDSFAILFLVPFAFLANFELTWRTAGLLVLLGVFGTAAAHALFINGMKRIGARTASIISALEPVYGVALALAFLKESPSLRTVSGGAVILAAALTVSLRAGRLSN
ncbi:MAG: DMT family transporter [Candidatus Aminicenantales bacterium]